MLTSSVIGSGEFRDSGRQASESLGRILLIDDEAVFADSTRSFLVERGYLCDTAPDRASAVRLLESQSYDVIVADLRLPGSDGLDFVRELHPASGGPPVIIVTAFPSIDTAVGAVDLRVFAYLLKPVDLEHLAARIDAALSHSHLRDSLEAARVDVEQAGRSLERVSVALDRSRSESLGWSVFAFAKGEPEAFSSSAEARALTGREREIVLHLLAGHRVSTIADALGISAHTVRNHLKSVFLKLEVGSQVELLEKLKPLGAERI